MAIDTKKLLPSSDNSLEFIAIPKRISLPTAKIIPNSREKGVLGLANIVKGEPEDETGVSDKVKEDVASIRVTTKEIHKVLKKTVTINLKKIVAERKRRENEKRSKRESELEKSSIGGGISIPTKGPVAGLFNFMNKLLMGIILAKLVDLLPVIMDVVKKLQVGKVFDFLVDFSIGMFDKIVTFIDIGYKTVDKVNEIAGNIFGDDGEKKLKEFEGNFVKFMNLAIIAGMLSTGGTDFSGKKGGNKNIRPGFDRTGRRVNAATQQRYRQRFGEDKFRQRFGNQASKRLDRIQQASNTSRSAQQRYASRFGQNAAKNRFGQVVGNTGKRVAARGAGKIAGKIPIVGPLIDFGIRAFIFKEPLGKAAAGAVGAGVGQALGTWLGGVVGGLAGSVVPIVGNLLGAAGGSVLGGLIGGVIGDQIGVSLYNVIAGDEKTEAADAAGLEAKYMGGRVGSEEDDEAEAQRRAMTARIKRFDPPAAQDPSGGQKEDLENIFGDLKDKDGPFMLIKKSIEKLRKRNNSMVSKIMSLGISLLTGRKIDRRIVGDIAKNLVSFFDAALPAPMGMLRVLLQKLTAGGTVVELPYQRERRLSEISRKVENSFLRDVTQNTSEVDAEVRATAKGRQGLAGLTIEQRRARQRQQRQQRQQSRRYIPPGQSLPGVSSLAAVSGSTGTASAPQGKGASVGVSYSPFAKGSGAVITSGFGPRWGRHHNGIDIAAPEGTPLYAYMDGEVTHTSPPLPGAGYGNWIVWKDNNHGVYHFFGHLYQAPSLKVGDKFKAGAELGITGNTGNSEGPHLHWELSKNAPAPNGQFSSYMDPINWVNSHSAVQKVSYTPNKSGRTQPETLLAKASYEENKNTLMIVDREVPVTRTIVKTVNTNSQPRLRNNTVFT